MADFDPALLTFDGETNVYVLDDADIDISTDESKTADGPKADPLGLLGNIDRIPERKHTRCTHARRAHIRSPSETSSEDDAHSEHSEHSECSGRSEHSDIFSDVRAALDSIKEEAVKPDFQFGNWPTAATEQPPPCVDKVPRPRSLFRRQAKA